MQAQLLWPHHDEHANDCAQCAPQLVGKTRLSLRCKGAPACNLGVKQEDPIPICPVQAAMSCNQNCFIRQSMTEKLLLMAD
eukprot:scaffold68609_cov17-Tisochrysis_lutea.AAC.4